MIEQLKTAHESFIAGLKAEHEAALDAKVKSLDKTINSQALELKATQDDLAKAKAALSASMAEIETLRGSLEKPRRPHPRLPLARRLGTQKNCFT